MNSPQRTRVVLIVALHLGLLLSPNRTASQEAKPATEGLAGPLSISVDTSMRTKLAAAGDYIQAEDWMVVLPLLQRLLEMKQDTLTLLANREGKLGRLVSVHAEAERLLAGLPNAGRDFYQSSYGARAAEWLAKGRKNKDVEQLSRVVRFYLYTDAGPLALRDLARLYHQAGEEELAGIVFEKLLQHRGLARWSADDLYAATIALRRSGHAAAAEVTRKELLARGEPQGLRLDKRSLRPDELRKELEGVKGPSETGVWPLYGGDVRRSAQGIGGAPFLVRKWSRSTVNAHSESYRGGEVRANHREDSPAYPHLRNAEKWFDKRNQPLLSSFAPIAVTVTKGGEKEPLLIYKDYWGINAFNMRTREWAWDSPASWSLERMLGKHADARNQQALTGWLDFYVGSQNQWPQILFENSTATSLSSDGKFVYVIDDFAVPPPDQRMNPHLRADREPRYGPEINDAIRHNCLQAYSLQTNGKLTWEVGEKGELADTSFLGAPLVLGGRLYVLTEKDGELRLVCLNAEAGGEVLWTQSLAQTRVSLKEDSLRRTQAAHVAYGNGILICPSNAGAVFGVDLLSRRMAWVYPYRDKSGPVIDAERHLPGRNPDARVIGGKSTPITDAERQAWRLPPGVVYTTPGGRDIRGGPVATLAWRVTAPMIHDDKLVFTPPDHPSLHCLSLRDGSPLWTHEKKDDDLYLAGVYGEKVLIVGKRTVRALNLATGASLWTLETGSPSGQGIASNNVYYLPLKTSMQAKQPEICAIDLTSGHIVSHIRSRPKGRDTSDLEVPGNLLFFEGDLISQTPWEVVAYPQLQVQIAWFVPAKHLMIGLDQFQDLPLVLLTARHQKWEKAFGRMQMSPVVGALAIDKRMGKVTLKEDNLPGATPFHTLRIQTDPPRIELISSNIKLIHILNREQALPRK
jgi:hypothetical protein